jgi:hypothetical protein
LVTGAALRGLVGLLSLSGLSGIAAFVAGGALVGGALSLSGDSAGADERAWQAEHPESSAKESWFGRKVRDASNWIRRKLGLDHGGVGGRVHASHSGAKLTDEQRAEMAAGIRKTATELGIDPKDLAGLISFETGGTMDPWKAGPHTKWGQHRGLIQWGEPQRKQYGVDQNSTITEQMAAVTRYLRDHGVKPGMDLPHLYSAVLHGNAASGLDVTDANGTSANSGARSIIGSAHYGALAALERQRANAAAGLNGWIAALAEAMPMLRRFPPPQSVTAASTPTISAQTSSTTSRRSTSTPRAILGRRLTRWRKNRARFTPTH